MQAFSEKCLDFLFHYFHNKTILKKKAECENQKENNREMKA